MTRNMFVNFLCLSFQKNKQNVSLGSNSKAKRSFLKGKGDYGFLLGEQKSFLGRNIKQNPMFNKKCVRGDSKAKHVLLNSFV